MRIWLYIVVAFTYCGQGCFAQQSTPRSVNWLSFEQLSDSLAVNPKKVIIFFHTDWCAYCKKMLKESFGDARVIQKVEQDYYAVKFDAERVDTVFFEGHHFANSAKTKRTGQYHSIFELLSGRQSQPSFPYTIVFSEDFTAKHVKRKYLSVRELLKIL